MAEDETTTTPEPVETGAAEVALPAEQTTSEADSSKTEVSQSTNEGAEEALPKEDDKLASFAKGQGIDDVSELSEREQKLLKMAHDNNAEFQRGRQKATELEKTMGQMGDESAVQVAQATGRDPEVLKALQNIQVKESIRDFFDENPEAKQYQADMATIAVESGLSGSPEAILKASYALAVANNTGAIKSQGKQEALKKLAQTQQAAVPRGNATTPNAAPKTKDFKDMSIKEMEAHLGTFRR